MVHSTPTPTVVDYTQVSLPSMIYDGVPVAPLSMGLSVTTASAGPSRGGIDAFSCVESPNAPDQNRTREMESNWLPHIAVSLQEKLRGQQLNVKSSQLPASSTTTPSTRDVLLSQTPFRPEVSRGNWNPQPPITFGRVTLRNAADSTYLDIPGYDGKVLDHHDIGNSIICRLIVRRTFQTFDMWLPAHIPFLVFRERDRETPGTTHKLLTTGALLSSITRSQS